MAHLPHAFLPGASKRLEALSDGVFAIACTLLVLEIDIPHFKRGLSIAEQWHEFSELIPSLIAFGFSFLNILVFWTNHDAINKVIVRYDTKTTYLNIIFLLFISLIPFTTAFIARNIDSFLANACYGVVLFLASTFGCWTYHHLAFKAKLFLPEVTMASRKKVSRQVVSGPILFIIAIASGLINNYISITIYALIPVSFMFLPQLDFDTKEEELKKEDHG
jgi:TMEM175 potassium channel family protein